MTVNVVRRKTCRLCDAAQVDLVVKMEPIPLAEQYAATREAARAEKTYPVDLYMCRACGHVQQLDVIDSKTLWEGYTYFSGQAKGMVEHFEDVAASVIRRHQPPAGRLVVDIGSNDGSLLKPFKKAGYRVLGVDPAKEIARAATEAGIETIPDVLSLSLAEEIRRKHGPASVVCAFNAFAHADNMGEMADSIRTLLAPDGLFFFEVQYLLDVIDRVLMATIFHEHMSHHSVKPMKSFLERHGMELIGLERVEIQHGSLIGTVQLAGGRRRADASVDQMLALETERRLDQAATLRGFADKLTGLKEGAARLVEKWKSSKATVIGYGAARSGPTILSQLKLADSIEFIVDDHPQKVGKFSPGDGIPIRPTRELLQRMPDYAVILAWVHANKIIQSNREYLDKGGQFVAVCPDIRVVGSKGEFRP